MNSVLITGGAGYIGSHIAKAFAHTEFQPVVLDDLSAGHHWAVKWGPLVEGGIDSTCLIRRLVDQYNIQAVIHCAAHAGVTESMHSPRKYFDNNITRSLVLLDTLLDCGIDKVVFSSSCAVYGAPRSLPIGESHAKCPMKPVR